MCGRYYLDPGERFEERFGLTNTMKGLKPLVATPGSKVPVIVFDGGKKGQVMKWGLVPSWSSEDEIGSKLFNARAETIDKKASFSHAFLKRRCLVPISYFYEWQKKNDKKIPYTFGDGEDKIIALAGIYEGDTFTVVTTEANNQVKPIHPRMPVILQLKDEDRWLVENDKKRLLNMLKPFSGKLVVENITT